ncbi:MAG TPA: hypothetical protein VGE11_05725, partial [Pseudonocardia sp.]
MRERTHGYAGMDHPEPGEQQQSWVRPPRRGAVGPRPVRPPGGAGSARPGSGLRLVPAGTVASEADSGPAARGVAPRGFGPAAA